jgi:pentatricopeptide repeat protein
MPYTTLQAGDISGARQALEDMRAAGVPPNAVTYTIMMDRLVAADDLKVDCHPSQLEASAPSCTGCCTARQAVTDEDVLMSSATRNRACL